MKRHILALIVGLITVAPGFAEERIFVYPAQGQSDQQQAEDRYHCHRWAVEATGFDPMSVAGYQEPRYVRVPAPDNPHRGDAGRGMFGGAIAGAAIGEIGSGNAGQGAAIGAILGALLGSISESEGEQQRREQAQYQAEDYYADRREVAMGRASYRRALAACLEGRGYNVN